MLIACKFKRPKAPVDLGDKTYFFIPIDSSNPDSEHVADVDDNDHIQRLLSIPEGYYIAQAQSLPTVSKPAAPAPNIHTAPVVTNIVGGEGAAGAGDSNPAPAPTGSNDTVQLPEELQAAAETLNGLSWQKLKAELTKGGIEKVVLKAALDIELAKPEADQRATTLKLLNQELGA